ncbi:methyltransferase domain-containing protein [Pengzhenrongella frigida]|uniref:Methyltransferase domain-containing protein n=1 Tax=Pengzhenrongella frigida TaxID=1259133 RepID=A0A4Q5MV63_9MICO|nr:methyltransferase domain-containing protein [Cellulomonas sp. HLT2-17]RYV49472.1 methyltransferase domain-containing protein [Cellulomonas sp. HLT2-17]
MTDTDQYTHGHQESVLRSHRWRTAENSAGYLLPALYPGQRLLDVGCGPGTITIDLATRVAPGEVIGLDKSERIVEVARVAAGAAGVTNLAFQVGDVYALPFEDGSFDVVHAHQVLQHLTDPVAALRELRRVTRPGGLVAVRDADYAAMTWYPPSAGLDEWSELYHEVTQANGAEADAGRRLLSWVRAAGFDPAGLAASAGTWCYATPEDREWWAELWAERSTSSDFAKQAVAHGLADDVGLEHLAAGWRAWGRHEDGWFAVLHGEVLARV